MQQLQDAQLQHQAAVGAHVSQHCSWVARLMQMQAPMQAPPEEAQLQEQAQLQHTLEEAEAEQAQLQRQVNALHTADLHLQEDEARCRLMADTQQPEVTGSELAAAVCAKWREQQRGEEDSEGMRRRCRSRLLHSCACDGSCMQRT